MNNDTLKIKDMSKQIPDHWLTIAKRINSIAQTGLTFTKDKFDREALLGIIGLEYRDFK